MNNNLVPKTLLDRNGRTTTRWVRPEGPIKGQPGHQPSPDLQKSVDAILASGKAIRSILADLKPHEGSVDASSWKEQRKKVEAYLSGSDEEYLRIVSALAKELAAMKSGGITTSKRRALVNQLEVGNRNVVRAFHAHRDEYEKHPALVSLHTRLIESLITRGIVRQEADGSIPTLSIHLKANQHYEGHRMARPAYGLVPSYENNDEYLSMVELHANHIDALLRYRADRGLESAANGPSPLDEEDFTEYLSHGPVADGML